MNEQDFDFFTDMLYESFYIPENKPSKEVLLTSSQLKKNTVKVGGEKGIEPLLLIRMKVILSGQLGIAYLQKKTKVTAISMNKLLN